MYHACMLHITLRGGSDGAAGVAWGGGLWPLACQPFQRWVAQGRPQTIRPSTQWAARGHTKQQEVCPKRHEPLGGTFWKAGRAPPHASGCPSCGQLGLLAGLRQALGAGALLEWSASRCSSHAPSHTPSGPPPSLGAGKHSPEREHFYQ